MELSIVFPAYNEEASIPRAIQDALQYLDGKDGEIIAVNDGSRDQTAKILDGMALQHPSRVRVIHHSKNLGYAPTLRDGFLATKGDWIFYTDSDNQFRIQELDDLWKLRDGADMVIGWRKDRQDPPFRIFAAGVYNLMVRTFFGLRGVRDIDCAFKLFRRDVFDRIQIESKAFLIDAEILIKASRQKMVIRETGVTHLRRTMGESTVRPSHVLSTLLGLAGIWCGIRTGRIK